jgi:Na+-translocating ferredoxin:NAD+ oxidoreductase RnfC subunit
MDRLGLAPYRGQPAPLRPTAVQPEQVRIPLQQHIGAPSRPVVKQGDTVKRGQLIAAIPDKALGAAIHASIDGVVAEVGPGFIRIERRS